MFKFIVRRTVWVFKLSLQGPCLPNAMVAILQVKPSNPFPVFSCALKGSTFQCLNRRQQQICELPAFIGCCPLHVSCASYWNSDLFSPHPPSDYTNWEAKVELILSALLVKAVAHCLRSAEMSLHPARRAYSHFVYLLLCLKYIILLLLRAEKLLCPCSLPLPRPGVWKLNIAFKSQFPQWDYANQPLPVSPFCFYSCLIYPPPPWCISPFAVVYSIHLRPSFSAPNRPNHVFPFCIAVLPRGQSVCVHVLVYASAYTNFLV